MSIRHGGHYVISPVAGEGLKVRPFRRSSNSVFTVQHSLFDIHYSVSESSKR